jgi:hypothetical protein
MSATDGVAFETLIYTDCTPGQGLQGSAGLQFQARSPGADRAAMSLVQGTDLYEPPANWMRERRALNEYPPSFAHAFDGVYATAAGVYLGREANGGREGNQLTHAIVSADPGSYLLHRPAQLFGAPFWSTEPAATTECEPLRHPWEPGPFDIEAAQTMVADRADGADLLGKLLTSLLSLDRSDSRRVLFIGEDPAEVLRWISAATLLLPQRQALGIGFKVFTTNPAYATQPVIAVHPGWDSTAVTVDDDGGYAVFDLATNRVSKITPDERAQRWVRLLLDEDAYDVLDMVEMAAASGRENPDDAFELAQSMVLRGRALAHEGARIAVSWLKTTPPTLLTPSRDVLVGKLLHDVRQWSEDILVDLDEVARTGQIDPERMPDVRIALITAELDRAARHGTASKIALDELPPSVWTARHSRACEVRVVEELQECESADAFDSVLRVAQRFRLTVDFAAAPEALANFVRHWADHPEMNYDTAAWGSAERPLRRALNAELTGRVLLGHADEVGDAWCQYLTARVPLPDAPLDAALLAAQMARSDPGRRADIIETALSHSLALAPEECERSVTRTTEALWRRDAPSAAEYRLVAEIMPTGFPLDPGLFRPLVTAMTAGSARLAHEDLALLRDLYEKALIPRTAAVKRLLRNDEDLAAICRRLPGADVPQLAEFPRVVSTTTMPVRHVWSREIAEAMLRVKHPHASDLLLKQLPIDYHRAYLRDLFDRLRRPTDVVLVAVAYQLTGADFLRPEDRDACLSLVQHWIRKANDKRRKQATGLVEETVSRKRQHEWAALLDDREGHSWSRWRRGKTEG